MNSKIVFMSNNMKCIFVIMLICVIIEIVASHHCYWNTGCPYQFFSSRTRYNAVRGDIRDNIINVKGCEPISIWGMLRHGKRYPGKTFAAGMKEALNLRNNVHLSNTGSHNAMCAQDVENLRNMPVDNKFFQNAHHLKDEGYQEMAGIGSRMKQAFPSLLTNLEPGSYTFRPAFGDWIVNSGKAFIEGLNQKNLTLEKVTTMNYVMAPYAICGSYQRDVKLSPKTYTEADKYFHHPDYLAAKDRVQRLMGGNSTLTNDNITGLYDLCRYLSSDNRGSPWCALFTTEDLKAFEYIGDLRHYYRNGYGTPINKKFGPIPMADLLKNFQLAKDGHGKKIIAYFTHETMIDMIYVALGLFKDPIRLTSEHRNLQRKWRTSKISNFAVNLLVVLNRCTTCDNTDYNVVFYLNEEPLRSMCNNSVCSWHEFEEKFMPFTNAKTDFCEFESDPY